MFRFTIREMMLVMVIGAMALGWCVDRSRLATRNDRLDLQLASSTAACQLLKAELRLLHTRYRRQSVEVSDLEWRVTALKAERQKQALPQP